MKLSIDAGTINSAENCGQNEFASSPLSASADVRQPFGWATGELVFLHPGKLMDDVCLV